MSNVAHEVKTDKGTVTVHGKDVTTYAKWEQWVNDHSTAINTAIGLAGLAVATKTHVHSVRKK